MGCCLGTNIENGHYDNFDDIGIQAEKFYYYENLEKKLENDCRFNKIFGRKLKQQSVQYIKELKNKRKQQQSQRHPFNLKENNINHQNHNKNQHINKILCKKEENINKIKKDNNIILNDLITTTDDNHFKKFNYQMKYYSSYNNMKRSSSLNYDEICIHCEHNHLRKCCQYYNDTNEDIVDYAIFKINLEKPSYYNNTIDFYEKYYGQTTPLNFPKWSDKKYSPTKYFQYCPSNKSKNENINIKNYLSQKIQHFKLMMTSKEYWNKQKIVFEDMMIGLNRILMVVG